MDLIQTAKLGLFTRVEHNLIRKNFRNILTYRQKKEPKSVSKLKASVSFTLFIKKHGTGQKKNPVTATERFKGWVTLDLFKNDFHRSSGWHSRTNPHRRLTRSIRPYTLENIILLRYRFQCAPTPYYYH